MAAAENGRKLLKIKLTRQRSFRVVHCATCCIMAKASAGTAFLYPRP